MNTNNENGKPRQSIAEMLAELEAKLEGQKFVTPAEAEAYVQEIARRKNETPLDDFQGLSPEQMYAMLYYPLESPHIVELPDVLDAEPDAPIITLFKFLIDGLGEKGMKATATGNLLRNFCRDAMRHYMSEEEYNRRVEISEFQNEFEAVDFHITRITAQRAKLIRLFKGKFVVTNKCKDILRKHGMAGIYPLLLKTYARHISWDYAAYLSLLPIIQDSFLFLLYMLIKYGDTWRREDFYEALFLKAYPGSVHEIPGTPYLTSRQRFDWMFSASVLRNFFLFFGLAERKPAGENPNTSDYLYRKLPLLEKAVKFKV